MNKHFLIAPAGMEGRDLAGKWGLEGTEVVLVNIKEGMNHDVGNGDA